MGEICWSPAVFEVCLLTKKWAVSNFNGSFILIERDRLACVCIWTTPVYWISFFHFNLSTIMCKNKQLSKNTGDKIVDLHKAWMASEKMKIDFTAITWKWKLHKKTISCSQSGVPINILAHGTRMIMKYVAELQRRSLLMIWRQPQSPRTPLVTHYAVMDRNLAAPARSPCLRRQMYKPAC